MITRTDVESIANLARLELTEQEKELFCKQLNQVLESFDLLKEVNTEGVEPTAHPIPMVNIFREDKAENKYARDELFSIVPDDENGYIKVPKILGDS